MIKLLVPLFVTLSTGVSAQENWEELIKENKYNELKQRLYLEKPNVLDRTNGLSIFDIAIKNKDKRSAIIVAEYQNFSLKNSEIKTIFDRIALLKSELEGESDSNIKNHLKETVSVIENLEERVTEMEGDNVRIKEQQILAFSELQVVNEHLSKLDTLDKDALQFIVKKLKDVEGKILSEEDAKAFISASQDFIESPAITLELNK